MTPVAATCAAAHALIVGGYLARGDLQDLSVSDARELLTRTQQRIEQLETVAASFGLRCRKPGGSHVIFEHPAVAEALSVPARRPIKPIYVTRFVRLIEAVRGNDERD